MLPASYTESCGNKIQINCLARFLWPSSSLFHPVNWMKMASGISSAGKCSYLQMQHLLSDCFTIWFQQTFQFSGFSRLGFFGEEYNLPGNMSKGKLEGT